MAEFIREDADYIRKLEQWKSTSDQTNGYCALIVAMGVTGVSRGNPQPKDMMAIFEAKVIDVQTLGLGVLQLQLDWE